MTSEQLLIEVANLRAENNGLRRRLPASTGDMRKLRQAYRDAKALLLRRFSGYSISRAESDLCGVSRRRWPWAIALLRTAGVYGRGDICIQDFHTAVTMLDVEFGAMERAGVVTRLRAGLPPSAR
jgi:hypothetical protein